MRVSVLNETYVYKGVSVMETINADFPLETVIEMELGSPINLQIPGIRWTRKLDTAANHHNTKPGPIGYFDDDGNKRAVDSGIVFYGAFSEMADFMTEKVDPDAKGELSDVIRRSRSVLAKT